MTETVKKQPESGFNTYKNLPYRADLDTCDYVVAGIGFDSATSGSPGTRFAPDAIRNCYWKHMGYNQNLEVETSLASGTDYGNIEVKHGYILPSFHMITSAMKEFLSHGVVTVILGGDHSVTLPELRAIKEYYGPVALVHFDSHRDVRCFGTKYDHGTPFSRAVEEGLIDCEHSIQIGMRGGFHSKEYYDFAKDRGMKVIHAYELLDMKADAVIDTILKQVGNAPCFLTFDIDFLDPAAAPGTGTPVVGGPETPLARQIIRGIASLLDIKGFDIVEVAPDLDSGGLTCQAADGILVDMIGSIAKRKELGTLRRGSGVPLFPDTEEKTKEFEEKNLAEQGEIPAFPSTGIHTFMGFSHSRDISGADAVIYGMPYDCATSNRPGTRFAPREIRKCWGFSNYDIEFQFNARENFTGIDYGDFDIPYQNVHETMLAVTSQLDQILSETDGVTIGVGGDHALTFAELRSMKKKYGPMAFIHFDSHTDTWDAPDGDGNCLITHGPPFRLAINNGSLDAAHGIQIGLRSGGKTDHDFALSHGMKIIKAQELHKISLESAAQRIRDTVGDCPVFVTFDIDFIDPAYAPGTGTPIAGGFTTAEALKLLRLALPGLNIKGFDLVEVAPQYDTGNITTLAGARIISEFLSIASYNKNVLKQTVSPQG